MSPAEIKAGDEPVKDNGTLPPNVWASNGSVIFDQPREVVTAALHGKTEPLTREAVEKAIKDYLETPAYEG